MAAAAQNERLAGRLGAGCNLIQEALDQRGLADARGALDQHQTQVPVARAAIAKTQGLHLGLAPDEDRGANLDRSTFDLGHGRGCHAEAELGQDLRAAGSLGWIALQQLHAQPAQARIGQRLHLDGSRGILALLLEQNLDQASAVGQAPGQHLVKQGAHGIPVGSGLRRTILGLFGRHVGRGSHQPFAPKRARSRRPGQAEIQYHHPALRGHQHVRWLEIAVDAAEPVHGVHPRAELVQSYAQALRIRLRTKRRRRGIAGTQGVPVRQIGQHRRAARRSRTQQMNVEGHTRHVFHGEEPQWPLADQFMQRGQVGVLDVGQRTKLALEAVQVHAVAQIQQFERHLRTQLPIEDQIHGSHAPAAQETDDLEPIGARERHRSYPSGSLARPALNARVASSIVLPDDLLARRRADAIHVVLGAVVAFLGTVHGAVAAVGTQPTLLAAAAV